MTKEQKKKRLILGDWSSIGWPEYKVGAVRELLGKLLTNNFEIYMWQNGHLLPMNQDNLYLINQERIRLQMVADSYKAIEDVAAKLRLAKDTFHILDNHYIRHHYHPLVFLKI